MIQRFYLYGVAFVSLVAGMAALNQLTEALGSVWFETFAGLVVRGSEFERDVLAASTGVLVVAVPMYLLHMHFIQRRLADPAERSSGLRKLFLYAASAVALGYALFSVYGLLNGLLLLAFGQPLLESELWPDGWFHLTVMASVGLLLESYFHRVLVADGDYGHEDGSTAIPRRLFQVVAGLVGLALILFGASDVLQVVWRLVLEPQAVLSTGVWWREPLAGGAAMALVGAALSAMNWRRWQAVSAMNADEARSALRRLYLYAGVAVGAAAALAPAAGILREVLLLLLGSDPANWIELVDRLATPLGFLPVGIGIWVWYRRVLHLESERHGESPDGVLVRRIYVYVVAATGLVLVWFGAAETTSALLDWALRVAEEPGARSIWVETLATGLSLLIVGVPVWILHWRTAQRIAQRHDEAGWSERNSLPRKVYLYGATLAGALLILYYLARVIYRVLLTIMGDPVAGLLSVETADEMARAAISGILWVVHISAIRRDNHVSAAQRPDTLETERTRAQLTERIAVLERELGQAREALRRLEEEARRESAQAP